MYACVPLGWQRVWHTPNKKWAKEYLKVQFTSTTATVAGTMKLLSYYAVLLKLTHTQTRRICVRALSLATVLKIDCLNIQAVLFKTQFSHKFWPPFIFLLFSFCFVLSFFSCTGKSKLSIVGFMSCEIILNSSTCALMQYQRRYKWCDCCQWLIFSMFHIMYWVWCFFLEFYQISIDFGIFASN